MECAAIRTEGGCSGSGGLKKKPDQFSLILIPLNEAERGQASKKNGYDDSGWITTAIAIDIREGGGGAMK